jgi:hypothetical protein
MYPANPTRLEHRRETTCSRACSYNLRGRGLTRSREYFCAVCRKRLLRPPSHVKSRFVFCSRECHYAGRSLGLVERIVLKPYSVTAAGRLAWRKAGEERQGIPRKPPIFWTCEVCGKIRTLNRGPLAPARKLRYCSPECARIGLRGRNNPAWRGGHPAYYGPEWRSLQRLSRKLDGCACQRCAVSQKELGRALDVHHIKPVSSFKTTNDSNLIENVVSLCHNCHMIVEWNGSDFVLPQRCLARDEPVTRRDRT